jgi:hypothetical protein
LCRNVCGVFMGAGIAAADLWGFVGLFDQHEATADRRCHRGATSALRLTFSRTCHHFSGSHSDGRDRHDRGPRADALSQRMRATHRRHVHSAQPRPRGRPPRLVSLPGAPDAGLGEQRTAELTAARPPRDEKPADKPERGNRRRHRSRSNSHGPHAISATANRNKTPHAGSRRVLHDAVIAAAGPSAAGACRCRPDAPARSLELVAAGLCLPCEAGHSSGGSQASATAA